MQTNNSVEMLQSVAEALNNALELLQEVQSVNNGYRDTCGRHVSLAATHLENSILWLEKAIKIEGNKQNDTSKNI